MTARKWSAHITDRSNALDLDRSVGQRRVLEEAKQELRLAFGRSGSAHATKRPTKRPTRRARS